MVGLIYYSIVETMRKSAEDVCSNWDRSQNRMDVSLRRSFRASEREDEGEGREAEGDRDWKVEVHSHGGSDVVETRRVDDWKAQHRDENDRMDARVVVVSDPHLEEDERMSVFGRG